MSTTTKSRRKQVRHSVSPDKAAWVEFEYPSPNGRHHRQALMNLSCSGISFRFNPDEDLAGLEEGAEIDGVVVRVGACMIYGDMLAMHLTPGTDSEYVCGALFYPKSDGDLVKLKGVIAGMGVAGAD